VSVPRIAVARDGSHAVIVETDRGRVVRLTDRETVCEVPVGEVGWVGSRLVIVSAVEGQTDVRLIDPASDARRVAEIRIEGAMRLGATTGNYALLLGTRTAAVLSHGESTVTPYQFLARALPQVVGVAGTQFVVALPGTIEEWDPASRMPKRRLRLPRVAAITSLGGSERTLWMTTQQDPHRLDVLPLVNRGQPKAHELPEPIAAVSGHPHTDTVICIGAETGRLYAIDLDGRSKPRTIALPGIDRVEAAALVVQHGALSVIAVQTGRSIATAVIEPAREPEAGAPALPPIRMHAVVIEQTLPGRSESSEPASSLYEPDDAPRPVAETLRERLRPDREESPPLATITEAVRSRLRAEDPEPVAEPRSSVAVDRGEPPRAVRSEIEAPVLPRTIARTPPPPEEFRQAAPTAWSDGASELMVKLASLRAARGDGSPESPHRASWRDDAGAWARAVASGTFDRAAPSCPSLEVLAERFELPEVLVPALVLLYGSHLAGLRGAAPMDVARCLGRRWDDALGRGKLAELGVAVYAESRLRLADAILHVLDERPTTGELVGEPGLVALLGPAVLVSHEPIRVLGVRIVAQLGGAVLLGSDGDGVALALEARARGAIAVGHVDATAGLHHPILIIVDDDAAAEQLDLPRFELAPVIAPA